MWGTIGSPLLALGTPPYLKPMESVGIFMARATDARLLLRDAKRIIERRVRGRLKLIIGTRHAMIGHGSYPTVRAVMDEKVLLGLLLGVRSIAAEIDSCVSYSPRTKYALNVLNSAFPERRFWIEDAW